MSAVELEVDAIERLLKWAPELLFPEYPSSESEGTPVNEEEREGKVA